uniref:Mitochondrial transcription rescue factor 1 C-terminal domain-containing protein n=1 Tax=Oncorhynchus kisutch TaxID=8019 RepID=A0A8C7D1M8_ONCKI
SLSLSIEYRQLLRWSTHKLLNPGHGPYWTLHTRQLCSSMTIGTHKLPTRWSSAKTWSDLHQVRFKSGKKGGAKAVQDEEEDDEKDPEHSDYEDEPEDDYPDYNDMEKYMQSFHYWLTDFFCLYFCKVEDEFYGNKLRLNGQKLINKSKLGIVDTLDLVLSEKETDTELGKSKGGDQYNVVLRPWKNLKLPKQDAFKQ